MSVIMDDANAAAADSPRRAAASPLKEDRSRSLKDDDRALARMIQEQERAFYMLQHGGLDPEDDEGDFGDGAGAPGAQEGDPTAGPDDEPLDDEEFARRLQEEEDRTAYRQMFGQPGVDYSHLGVEGDEGEEEGTSEDGTDNLTYEDLQALGDMAGTVSKGLPPSVVAQLPVHSYSHMPAASGEPDKCCICQMDYEAEDEVKLLPCTHFFHVACLDNWLGMQKVCVLCNKEVPSTVAKPAPRA